MVDNTKPILNLPKISNGTENTQRFQYTFYKTVIKLQQTKQLISMSTKLDLEVTH